VLLVLIGPIALGEPLGFSLVILMDNRPLRQLQFFGWIR